MRTILVGDVHGCREELESLLERVAFTSGDRLVLLGDLVARGPDSLGVLDVARRTGAVLVRGNHEQRLLDWRRGLQGGAPAGEALGRMHRELARALRPVDWTLLETSPLFVDFPEHDLRAVHAGVVPGVPLDAQSPETLMRIRTVRRSPAADGGGEPELWGAHYEGSPHVVFGHNALGGLQLHPWATGLDTGCVYGRALTALVLGPGEHVPHAPRARRALLVSEPARRAWFHPELARTG